jgi:uncharacterized protein with PQ loop repeat
MKCEWCKSWGKEAFVIGVVALVLVSVGVVIYTTQQEAIIHNPNITYTGGPVIFPLRLILFLVACCVIFLKINYVHRNEGS